MSDHDIDWPALAGAMTVGGLINPICPVALAADAAMPPIPPMSVEMTALLEAIPVSEDE
jgi:hypothetical protein